MNGMVLDLPTLSVCTDAEIAIIALNRPEELNAYSGQMKRDLFAAFDWTDSEDDIRAVILTGNGRAFCAGADLSNGPDSFDYEKLRTLGLSGRLGEEEDGRDPGGKITLRIFASQKPVVCAINGAAVGFGATLALAADIRIASETAKFAFVFAKLGLVPEACSSWFLPKIVGLPKSLEWCLSGRFISAEEARAAGLIGACFPAESLQDAAVDMARQLVAGTAPVSVALTRRMLWEMAGAANPIEAHRLDSAAMLMRGKSLDAKEGIASFLDKRPSDFRDTVTLWRERIDNLIDECRHE